MAERTDAGLATFAEILTARADALPDKTAFVFLPEREGEEQRLSFGALRDRAQRVAARLSGSLAPGSRALLLYPPGLDYVTAVFACFYAGVVGVSAYPPHPRRLARTLPRLYAIAADGDVDAVLTTGALRDVARALLPQPTPLARVRWVTTDALESVDAAGAGAADGRRAEPAELAFLQYTSGSTANPRGVMLSHRNLLDNSDVIRRAFGLTEHAVGVIWLPPYHDMGLIGGILQPVYLGSTCVLMSPGTVVMHPLRWLDAISRYRATTSGGPDFAYGLCVRRIDPAERANLDLSSWEVAFNGAEPVRADTLRAFADAFAPHGFRASAFLPCYGLAEATLMVTAPRKDAAPALTPFATAALQTGHAMPAAEDRRASVLVGCGTAQAGHEIAIVDPRLRHRCAPGEVGEVWVTGPSVAAGYWRRPRETADVFAARLADEPAAGPFLRTGDFGFEHGGQLYIVGRLKDVLILNGRNYQPGDVEALAEAADERLRRHCSAAFTLDVDGAARLALVAEARDVSGDGLADVMRAVRCEVADGLGLQVHTLAVCGPGSVPKTTSGKIQRLLCRSQYLNGDLAVVAESRLGGAR
jgi:acyl-CoA synthetase (AMP-forming)/AMP-acid ligase II